MIPDLVALGLIAQGCLILIEARNLELARARGQEQ